MTIIDIDPTRVEPEPGDYEGPRCIYCDGPAVYTFMDGSFGSLNVGSCSACRKSWRFPEDEPNFRVNKAADTLERRFAKFIPEHRQSEFYRIIEDLRKVAREF